MPNILPLNAVKYDSTKLTNTHQFITVQAVNALTNDLQQMNVSDKVLEVINVIKENLEILKEGSIAPDYGVVGRTRDYAMYQDHFYDCDTDKNFTSLPLFKLFLGQVPDTAESQARAYYSRAIATFKDGDVKGGIFHLGQSLHMVEDGCEPHHCLLWTGGEGTAHTRFERYAEEVKGNHTIETVGDLGLYDIYKEDKFIDFIHKLAYENSKKSKELASLVSLKNTWEDWGKAIDIAIKRAQRAVAIVLLRFAREIAEPKEVEITSPIGKFHAIIKVADEKFAGTNSDIHFGVELKDGRTYDFKCDLPGNDFERGNTGTYQCHIGDKTIEMKDIKGFYVRKIKELTWEDQMLLDEIEVYIQGKRVLKAKPYKWLSSIGNNDIIKFSV